MTALLVGVTFVALGLAGALAFYVLRLSRENRERHEARAAVLADRLGSGARMAAPAETFDLPVHEPHHEGPPSRPTLFADADTTPAGGPRWLLAAGAVVVLLALGGIYLFNRAGTTAAASQGSAPIELTSLRHERSGQSLVITGMVHNPTRGRAHDDLVAVIFTFDAAGNYLSSGRAGLDFRQLPPGEESPFSITLPSGAGVARYRVSFRTDAAVVPHLDRRNQPAPTDRGAQQ
jgi:hypothetical protein